MGPRPQWPTGITVQPPAHARMPTCYGDFQASAFTHLCGHATSLNLCGHATSFILVTGDLGDGQDVLVRVHSQCLTGDVMGSLRCDCGTQLRTALEMISNEGRGILIYLLDHEGRGIGLPRKLQAYHLQDRGLDTVDANLCLGLPADARNYSHVPAILADLGVVSVRLLTNNPDKVAQLMAVGVNVGAQIRMPVAVTTDNVSYLITKRDRMGHQLGGLVVHAPSHLLTYPVTPAW